MSATGNLSTPGGTGRGAAGGWTRLGVWWVSRAGLDAIAARLYARRLLTDPVVYVVLRKTYHRNQTPAQIAAWFAATFPRLPLLVDEGFIRYVLAVVERPQPPQRPDRPQGTEAEGRS